MNSTSLALKIGSLVLGLGAYLILFKKVKGLKKYGLSGLIYILLLSFMMSSSALFLLMRPNSGEIISLLFAQIVILSLGTLHVFFAPRLLPWYSDQHFGMKLVYIICILLFCYFFTNLYFTFIVDSYVEVVWHLSSLWFLVPVLINQTIHKLLEVPPKQYKKWKYPVDINIPDPTDGEMENPVLISFIFKKTPHSPEETTFRAKAPHQMELGRLFYFFINDYNSKYPESPVSYVDENNQPHEWIFFKVKSKFLKLKTALDPDNSIAGCKIKENCTLVCSREMNNQNNSGYETTE